jgi:hypothetical protein
MEPEFRVFVRLDQTDPTHRKPLGVFDNLAEAEEIAREHEGAYVEPWLPHGKVMLCAGRFAPGIYHPEGSERAAAARFVRETVKL